MRSIHPHLSLAAILFLALGLLFTSSHLMAAPAPDWSLQDLTGKTIKLSDFKGKVVILDFWATWCPPCRAEIPHFVDLQKQYKDQGLVIIGMSLDEGGNAVVAPFAKKQNINYPVVIGNQDIAQQYGGVQGIPTTFVIDPSGNIVSRHEGFTDPSVFEGEIKKILPGVGH